MKPSYYLAMAALPFAAAGFVRAQLPKLPDLPAPPNLPPAQPASRPLPTITLPPKLPDAPPPPVEPRTALARIGLPPAAVATGRFAVMKDNRLIEGTVTVAGNKVTIRRGVLDADYPRGEVLFVGVTKDEVYNFQKGLINLAEAKARLQLAKWCSFNGMREEALGEARAAARLDPSMNAAGQMARSLEESLRRFPPAGAQAAPTVIPPSQSARPTTVVEPEPDIDPEAYTAFRTRVHPILTNLCMHCHGRPDAAAFLLARPDGYDAAPSVIRHNIRTALAHVRKDDPSASPLLTKALAPHGGMRAPAFASRQAPAFQTLVGWVNAVAGASAAGAATAESVKGPAPSASRPALPPAPEPKPAYGLPPIPPIGKPLTSASSPLPLLPVVPPPSTVGLPVLPTSKAKSALPFGADIPPKAVNGPSPTNAGEPVDEFDPSAFNRAVHPDKAGTKK